MPNMKAIHSSKLKQLTYVFTVNCSLRQEEHFIRNHFDDPTSISGDGHLIVSSWTLVMLEEHDRYVTENDPSALFIVW